MKTLVLQLGFLAGPLGKSVWDVENKTNDRSFVAGRSFTSSVLFAVRLTYGMC